MKYIYILEGDIRTGFREDATQFDEYCCRLNLTKIENNNLKNAKETYI